MEDNIFQAKGHMRMWSAMPWAPFQKVMGEAGQNPFQCTMTQDSEKLL